jgi:hypothetical protein
MEYNGSDKICRRLVGLFLLHKHNLLCPTGLIQDFNKERAPYQVAKALLLQLCNTVSTQPFFIDRVLITPSTTKEGELVLLCCKSNNPKHIIKTEFMVEDAIHDQTLQPLTQLLTYVFNNTNGMLPITTTNFYDAAIHVKYFPRPNVDAYYCSDMMRSLQSPLSFRKKAIANKNNKGNTQQQQQQITPSIDYSPLYEGHDERDYTIITFMFHALERQRLEDTNLIHVPTAKFFLEFNDLSKKIWKSLQAHEDHSVDTFMNLALCTSGRFIDEIRERYRKTFPHNPIGDDSKLNDLCRDLLSNTKNIVFNDRKPTTDQIKLHNVPKEYLSTKHQFKSDEESSKQWLLKHFGYDPDEISDLKNKTFQPQVAHISKPIGVIQIEMSSDEQIYKWFTNHIFKPFQNIALTTEFISFFAEALQIFEIVQRRYDQQHNIVEPTFIDPLFTNVLEECRNKWLWFIQHHGRQQFHGTPCQDLRLTDISNHVFGYTSQHKDIDKLIRAFGRFDPIHNDKNAIVDNWINTTMGDEGNIFILIIYWLLIILEEKKLIINKT